MTCTTQDYEKIVGICGIGNVLQESNKQDYSLRFDMATYVLDNWFRMHQLYTKHGWTNMFNGRVICRKSKTSATWKISL